MTQIPQYTACRMAALLAFLDDFRGQNDAICFSTPYDENDRLTLGWTVRDEIAELVDRTYPALFPQRS